MIEVADIHKKFKEVNALDGVSFQVNKGELFGVIGPDGAGKTTLFRLIISLMLPDSGSIRLWGLDPVKDYKKVRRIIGICRGASRSMRIYPFRKTFIFLPPFLAPPSRRITISSKTFTNRLNPLRIAQQASFPEG